MNGIHDMGGMHGFGAIELDPAEKRFSHDWERRTFAMFIAVFAAGVFNVDEFRNSIELMPPQEYLRTSYYEKWLHALEYLTTTKGVLGSEEIAQRIEALKEAANARSH